MSNRAARRRAARTKGQPTPFAHIPTNTNINDQEQNVSDQQNVQQQGIDVPPIFIINTLREELATANDRNAHLQSQVKFQETVIQGLQAVIKNGGQPVEEVESAEPQKRATRKRTASTRNARQTDDAGSDAPAPKDTRARKAAPKAAAVKKTAPRKRTLKSV